MRWRSWLYILLVEVISAALTTAVGILTNVLTNEKHPKTVVIVILVTFAASSGILQMIRHAAKENKSQAADRVLKGVKETTHAILSNQLATNRTERARRTDETLTHFPTIFRSWIKAQWSEEPNEIDRILDALTESTTSPCAVALEWQQRIPEWLRSLPWRALLVAGELANAYGASQLSVNLFLAAIAEGATRQQYWRARAALLLKFCEDTQTASRTLADGGVDGDSQDRF